MCGVANTTSLPLSATLWIACGFWHVFTSKKLLNSFNLAIRTVTASPTVKLQIWLTLAPDLQIRTTTHSLDVWLVFNFSLLLVFREVPQEDRSWREVLVFTGPDQQTKRLIGGNPRVQINWTDEFDAALYFRMPLEFDPITPVGMNFEALVCCDVELAGCLVKMQLVHFLHFCEICLFHH